MGDALHVQEALDHVAGLHCANGADVPAGAGARSGDRGHSEQSVLHPGWRRGPGNVPPANTGRAATSRALRAQFCRKRGGRGFNSLLHGLVIVALGVKKVAKAAPHPRQRGRICLQRTAEKERVGAGGLRLMISAPHLGTRRKERPGKLRGPPAGVPSKSKQNRDRPRAPNLPAPAPTGRRGCGRVPPAAPPAAAPTASPRCPRRRLQGHGQG